jgi:hypothetical protein
MKNLTYDQLIELAPKDRPFQINFNNENTMWVCIINRRFLQSCFDQEDGTRIIRFKDKNAKFTLIDPRYQKPEVLKAGQKVRILESILDTLGECEDLPVGRIATIKKVVENQNGLKYRIETWYVPHYCVMPVEEKEVSERTVEDILSELSDEDKEIIRNKLK